MTAVRCLCFSLLIFGSSMLLGQSNTVVPNKFAPAEPPVPSQPFRSGSEVTPQAHRQLLESYGKLPLSFEANQGQTDARVKFLSRGSSYSLFLASDEAVFSFRGSKAKANGNSPHIDRPLQPADLPTTSVVLSMKLVNANPAAKVVGENELAGKSNYFVGNDPKKWSTNVANYAKVKYEGVYSGIDLVYYGNQRQLEYDFVVAPGADPRRIQLDVRGANKIREDDNGDLVLQMGQGELRWHKPIAYQEKDGTRQEIAAHYVLKDKDQVEFAVAGYDLRRTLFIDPLIYSTYLGGNAGDVGNYIAVDNFGNAYVTGQTCSVDFPTTSGAFQQTFGEGGDCFQGHAFVSMVSASGSELVYSTYLGGNGEETGAAIAVDGAGNAYVAGLTSSTDFPTVNAFQPNSAGGPDDAFVAKLNSAGSALLYSTYLGGSFTDEAGGIAIDSSGEAYVTGSTVSTDFPVTPGSFQTNCRGDCFIAPQAFVTKFNAQGSGLVYSTYLGGSTYNVGVRIATDDLMNAYVTGDTCSSDFPTTTGAFQTSYGGVACSFDAFVTKLNPAGSALVYSTYLGGSFAESSGIAVDSFGDAYVTGFTYANNFPTTPGAFRPSGGGANDNFSNWDGFVTKLNPAGTALMYSTYLGGSDYDVSSAIAIDRLGDAYITGVTCSTDFPTTPGAFQPNGRGGCAGRDAFVTELNSAGSGLLYSTYLGGTLQDQGLGIAVDSWDSVYVTGATSSIDFPTMNPLQPTSGGGYDAFVAKLPLAIVYISGSPQQPLTKDSHGNFVAFVTVMNTSNIAIASVQVTIAGTTLGTATILSAPPPVTNLLPGASAIVTLTFPDTTALSKAATAALKVSGTYSIPAVPLNGNWTLSFRSVSLK